MAKPQVFFVHGMWSQAGVWSHWKPRFEAKGYTCTALTLPGHAKGAAEASLCGLGIAQHTDSVVQALRPWPKPIVVGHSMGGLIAQQVAALVPLTAAVLVNSAAPAPVFALRPVMLPGLARHFARWALWRKSFRLAPWEAQHLLFNALPAAQQAEQQSALQAESGRVAYQLGFGALNLAGSNRVARERIRCPLLALAGGQDHIIPIGVSRAMAAWYGNQLDYREHPQHAHWMLGEPGWRARVDEVLNWLEKPAKYALAAIN